MSFCPKCGYKLQDGDNFCFSCGYDVSSRQSYSSEYISEPQEPDELFAEAGRCIINSKKASIGYLERMLKIGFNRAARLMDSLAEEGIVGAESGTKAREILMSIEEFEEYLTEKGM